MAKKDTELKGPDVDIDNFDFMDMSDIGLDSNDRKPLAKFASSFYQTAKSKPFDANLIETTLRQSLPGEYGEAITSSMAVKDRVESLYNKSVERASPILKDARSIGKSVNNALKGKLPKSVTDYLDKKFEGDSYRRNRTTREDEMNSDISSIFKQQSAESNMLDAEREKRDLVKHRIVSDKMGTTNELLSKINSFNNEIDYAYKKKSLELQFKSFFIFKDQLEAYKSGNDKVIKALESVAHNTSLPDAIKIHTSEMFGAKLKESFIDRTQNKLFNGINPIIENIYSNVERKAYQSIDDISMLVSSLEMGSGLIGSGLDVSEIAGGEASNKLFSLAGGAVGKKLHGKLSGNKKVEAGSARIGAFLNNPGAFINTLGRRADEMAIDDDDNSGKATLKRLARLAMRTGADLTDRSVGDGLGVSDLHASAGDAAVFDKRTYRTQNEVMPGLTARILREITSLRTGKDEDLLTFNYSRGVFTKDSKATKDIKRRLIKSAGDGQGLTSLNSFVDKVDDNNILSPSARESLKRQMLMNIDKDVGFDPYSFGKADMYHNSLPKKDIEELKTFFSDNYTRGKLGETNDVDKKITSLTIDARMIGRYFSPMMDEIELQVMLGNRDKMESLGYLNKDGSVNHDKVMDTILMASKGDTGENPNRPEEVVRSTITSDIKKIASTFKQRKGDIVKGIKDSSTYKRVSEEVNARISDDVKYQAWLLKNNNYNRITGDQLKENAGRFVKDKEYRDDVINRGKSKAKDLGEEARYQAWLMKHSAMGQQGLNKLESFKQSAFVKKAKQHVDFANEFIEYGGLKSIMDLKTPEGRRDAVKEAERLIEATVARVKDPSERTKIVKAIIADPRIQTAVKTIEERTGRSIMVDGKLNPNATHEDFVNELKKSSPKIKVGGGSTDFTDKTEAYKTGPQPEQPKGNSGSFDQMVDINNQLLMETLEIKRILGDQLAVLATGDNSGGRKAGFRYGFRSGVGKLFSGLGSIGKGYGKLAGGALGGLGGAFGFGIKALTGLSKRLIPGNLGAKDIYVKGEKLPRLYAKYLKEGRYVDLVTGKTIRSLKDINKLKGAPKIAFRDDPENILLDANDLIKGIHDIQGKPLLKNIGERLLGFYGGVLSPIPALFKLGASGLRGIHNLLFKATDVYIRGESEPRMTAHLMGQGFYRSKQTGKTIKSHKDVDGPVVDIDNNVVISASDLSGKGKGMVDVHGKPLKTNFEKILGLGLGAAKLAVLPLKMGFKALKFTAKLAGKGLGMLAGLGSGLMRKLGLGSAKTKDDFDVAAQSQSLQLLSSIYQILDDRLPGRRRVKGDKDGDGDRDGSAADIMANRKNPDNMSFKDKVKNKVMGNSTVAKLMAMAGFGAGAKAKGDDEDGDTYMGGSLDLGGDGDDDGKRKGKKAKGFKGKSLRLLKKVPGVGLIAGAGKMLGRGGLSVGRGLLTAGRLAIPAVAALVSLVGAPIVVGGVAAVAVAYGGYKLYKHLSEKQRQSRHLSKLRMAQYGVDYMETDRLSKIASLENFLIPKVKLTDEGGAIKIDDKDIVTIMDILDVKTSDDNAVWQMSEWFNKRFKPVFFKHLMAAVQVGITVDKDVFENLMKLTKSQQLDVVRAVAFEYTDPSPYTVVESPFGGPLTATSNIVFTVASEVEADIKQMDEDSSKTKTSVNRRHKRAEKTLAAAETAAVIAVTKGDKSYDERVKSRRGQRSKPAVTAAQTAKVVNVIKQRQEGRLANDNSYALPAAGVISSPYGQRVVNGKTVDHKGTDIAAPAGTPVYAMSDGVIIRREYSQSYGNVIYLRHTDLRVSRYAHLESFESGQATGDSITKGTVIGYIGNTGASRGNHLHFEVRERRGSEYVAVDPMKVLERSEAKSLNDDIKAEERLAKETPSQDQKAIEGMNTIVSDPKPSQKERLSIAEPEPIQATAIRKQDEYARVSSAQRDSQIKYSNEMARSMSESVNCLRSIDDTLLRMDQRFDSWDGHFTGTRVAESKRPAVKPVDPAVNRSPLDASQNKIRYSKRRSV